MCYVEEDWITFSNLSTVQAAAKDYEEKLRAKFPDSALPRLDMLLLGMGPDGHTASLFPGKTKETVHYIARIRSVIITII